MANEHRAPLTACVFLICASAAATVVVYTAFPVSLNRCTYSLPRALIAVTRPRPVHRLLRRRRGHRPTLRRQRRQEEDDRRSSRDQPAHVRQGDTPALLLLPARARVGADQLQAPGPGGAAEGPAADARRGGGAHGQVRARDSADEGAAALRAAQPLPAGQRPLRLLHRLLPPDGGPGAQHADPLLVVLFFPFHRAAQCHRVWLTCPYRVNPNLRLLEGKNELPVKDN
ncbi:hypothetical protein VPH35_061157 [Triticum aestivum]|uniref:Uncharacterized protein n=1 Tax=Aegilops tauschii TaxID=37682 RepID=M8BQV0_AEGTA